jgi:hypothetical protein
MARFQMHDNRLRQLEARVARTDHVIRITGGLPPKSDEPKPAEPAPAPADPGPSQDAPPVA